MNGSIPEQLIRDLHNTRGFHEAAFLAAHEAAPLTSVRLNPAKDIGLFPDFEKVTWCENGRYLPSRPVFTLDPAYHAGAYYVQEASSMFLDYLLRNVLESRDNLRVLDLCAAPGGKSTLLASLLGESALLISNDVIRTRATVLEENMVRWGYTNAWVTSNDPRDFAKLQGYFDVIVVDAPCSGSGLWRKDEAALGEWSEANVQLCSERQQRILADVWPALKQGGILVYATCSYSPQEDEDILDWLSGTYDVSPLKVNVNEEWGIAVSESEKGMTGYRFFPGSVKGEGFFIAAIRKNDEESDLQMPRFKTMHSKQLQQQAGFLLRNGEWAFLQNGKEEQFAIKTGHEPDWQLLQKFVYLRKTGVNLGNPAGKDWIPSHDVALSIDVSADLASVDVGKEQSLLFLKREDMHLKDLERGWLMVRYNGLGLGWIKSLGNRVNNYLPKSWRIRMDIPE